MADSSPTVLDRLVAAGIADDRARAHLAAGLVRVDGEVADGPDHPAPPPSRVVIDGADRAFDPHRRVSPVAWSSA